MSLTANPSRRNSGFQTRIAPVPSSDSAIASAVPTGTVDLPATTSPGRRCGFSSAVAYGDCLCKTLQCIAKGWDKIAVLEGARAELACLETAAKAECDRRTAGVLVTILDAYECCMDDVGSTPLGEERSSPPEQRGDSRSATGT